MASYKGFSYEDVKRLNHIRACKGKAHKGENVFFRAAQCPICQEETKLLSPKDITILNEAKFTLPERVKVIREVRPSFFFVDFKALNRLRENYNGVGLSKRGLARLVGIAPATLHGIGRPKGNPQRRRTHKDVIARLAEVLDTTIEVLQEREA